MGLGAPGVPVCGVSSDDQRRVVCADPMLDAPSPNVFVFQNNDFWVMSQSYVARIERDGHGGGQLGPIALHVPPSTAP